MLFTSNLTSKVSASAVPEGCHRTKQLNSSDNEMNKSVASSSWKTPATSISQPIFSSYSEPTLPKPQQRIEKNNDNEDDGDLFICPECRLLWGFEQSRGEGNKFPGINSQTISGSSAYKSFYNRSLQGMTLKAMYIHT